MKAGILFFVVVLCCCLHIQECLQPRGKTDCRPKGRVCTKNEHCCTGRCRQLEKTCRGQCNAETCKEASGKNRPTGTKCTQNHQCKSNICRQPNEKRCSGRCPCFFQ